MKNSIRSVLAISAMSIAMVACGTTGTSTPPSSNDPTSSQSDASSPSVQPSDSSSESPAEERDVAGTITIAEMAFSGPGGTVQEALDAGDSGEFPNLVNGVLFRDADGSIYLATAVSVESAPTFDGPMLEVLGMDSTGDSWDMANAELLGLEEANGIVFHRNAQVLGYLEAR